MSGNSAVFNWMKVKMLPNLVFNIYPKWKRMKVNDDENHYEKDEETDEKEDDDEDDEEDDDEDDYFNEPESENELSPEEKRKARDKTDCTNCKGVDECRNGESLYELVPGRMFV